MKKQPKTRKKGLASAKGASIEAFSSTGKAVDVLALDVLEKEVGKAALTSSSLIARILGKPEASNPLGAGLAAALASGAIGAAGFTGRNGMDGLFLKDGLLGMGRSDDNQNPDESSVGPGGINRREYNKILEEQFAKKFRNNSRKISPSLIKSSSKLVVKTGAGRGTSTIDGIKVLSPDDRLGRYVVPFRKITTERMGKKSALEAASEPEKEDEDTGPEWDTRGLRRMKK